ncbi:hypothetical protein PBY51_011200 [Eleginops maclovinus]|uniref:EF-hand domain-containing protein n=1 Tax=Eleginops maclovinus TaxID=56733 RepID=A0AAN8AK90_ELEMC|nr:hypothetical protein PBY51_011200 [Eleginops maclovinus]
MDEVQEQDEYEERLKDVFHSYDSSGCGSLSPEELSDLCCSLQLDEAVLQSLLQKPQRHTDRILSLLLHPADPQPLPPPCRPSASSSTLQTLSLLLHPADPQPPPPPCRPFSLLLHHADPQPPPPPCRPSASSSTLQILSLFLHPADPQPPPPPCRPSASTCTLQTLSVLLHPADPQPPPAPCRPSASSSTLQILSLFLHPADPQPPPPPCRPSTSSSTLQTLSLHLHPAEPQRPPAPCRPSASTCTLQTLSILLHPADPQPPPPPCRPSASSSTLQTLSLLLHPADPQPPPPPCRPSASSSTLSLRNLMNVCSTFLTFLPLCVLLLLQVYFDQFKNALILALSSSFEPAAAEQETLSKPDSPEIQPKFVKGSKRYGRRSTPGFIEHHHDFPDVMSADAAQQEDLRDSDDSAVPRKRERWNAHETSTEEFEAEGQMQLWNPDEPITPRGSRLPLLSPAMEGRLQDACAQLQISWDGSADHTQLMELCQHLGLERNVDILQSLAGDAEMNVQEFVSRVLNQNKPPTPSASTPYRQLKRLHSTQPFDEGGRRTASCPLSSSIGLRLFSSLDDGTGFTAVETLLDAWLEEGVENSMEILQALNFSLDGRVSLSDLTLALENELLVTKNGIHQAALASFRAEIRHLLERVDRELGEKERIRSDLEKTEKLKAQLAAEVDERHAAIEQTNNQNLRKLEQDHKERLSMVRSDLMKEMELTQQQNALQRETLEAELQKIREDESFLRDHLSISLQENRRLEMELLDSNDSLVEAQSQNTKLQTSLDSMMKEKFGDLDPSSADFLLQEERIKELRSSYEAHYRELQDRIDELQMELQEFHSVGRVLQPGHKTLSEELESKSPGMESDPGIGAEEVQPFSMSLEAEMMLEQLKEQHLQEIEELQNQLECKVNVFDEMLVKQKEAQEEQTASLALQHQQEVEALREEMLGVQKHQQELQICLEQEISGLQRRLTEEREEMDVLQEEELTALRQQLQEAHSYAADLEEQINTNMDEEEVEELKKQQGEEDNTLQEEQTDMKLQEERRRLKEEFETEKEVLQERHKEELRKHAEEIRKLQEEQEELSEAKLEEVRRKLQEEKEVFERRLLKDFEREKELLQERHKEELKVRLEEVKVKFEEEKVQLEEQSNESVNVVLEEQVLRMVREQQEKEAELRLHWDEEKTRLQELHQEALLQERLTLQERSEQRETRLREELEMERLQLEEDYEGMLQERVEEEKEKLETQREEDERRVKEERSRLEEKHQEEKHQEVMREVMLRHAAEREALSGEMEALREDIAQERRELEVSFNRRLQEVQSRLSGDQESVAERFQADVLKLEQSYQEELRSLSDKQQEQELCWEERVQEVLVNAEEQRRKTEEDVEREKERWAKEREEMELLHKQEVEELEVKNARLQKELEDLRSEAQTKELALSKQLNDLHTRLQGSLETKDELLALVEQRVLDTELLLTQSVQDFRHEREELLSIQTEMELQHNQLLCTSELQVQERMELLTERDHLRVKVEELEALLRQAAEDFELERKELQEHSCSLQEELRNREINAEREALKIQLIKELEMKLNWGLPRAEEGMEEAPNDASNPDGLTPLLLERDVDLDTLTEALDAVVGGNADEERHSQIENMPEVNQIAAFEDYRKGESPREKEGCCAAETGHADPESTSSGSPHEGANIESEKEAASQEMSFEQVSSPEAFGGEVCEKEDALESCEEEDKPQDVCEILSHEEEELDHETEVDAAEPEEPGELQESEVQCLTDWEHLTAEAPDERAHDAECAEVRGRSLLKLQALYSPVTEENTLLHEKVYLLQQKTEILENLLLYNAEKVKNGRQVMEENYGLKVKVLLLMEHVKELEMNALKTELLQIKYDDCMCENGKLKEQNAELEKRAWSLDSNRDFQEKERFSTFFCEFERQEEALSEDDLHDSCEEFEMHNSKLRRAITDLQDRSLTLDHSTQAHRSEAGRLAEENVLLRQKISALKEEDLKEVQEELKQTMEHLKKGKTEAQTAAETFHRQISELRSQSRLLEEQNGKLSEKNSQNVSEVENLQQQISDLLEENGRREAFNAREKTKMAACVCALDSELTKALQESARLQQINSQHALQICELRDKVDRVDSLESLEKEAQDQLAAAQERMKSADEALQTVKHHSARLKSDLRHLQKERDSLKQEVSVLHKQLQNSNEKNQQEQTLLKGENQRLHGELRSARGELRSSRDKVCELDASLLSLQQTPSSLEAMQQENLHLKQQLEAHRDLHKGSTAAPALSDPEALHQENEALRTKMAQLSTQLMESYQAQMVGLLPPSPHRIPRGNHRGEEPDNMQDERQRKMKIMEERMREIELSLRNVKLLLREKVAQLKDQLHKNGKADVLIRDLYEENEVLLEALEKTKQRHVISEKKNFLLEEKICSLNKIMCDLTPPPSLPYHY